MLRRTCSWIVALVAVAACQMTTSTPSEKTRTDAAMSPIKFAVDVPEPPPQLTVLPLTRQEAPTQLVQDMLPDRSIIPLVESTLYREHGLTAAPSLRGIVQGDDLRAWIDNATGDAEVYAPLSELKPLEVNQLQGIPDLTQSYIAKYNVIPAGDGTSFVVTKRNLLSGMTVERDGDGPTRTTIPQADYLAYVPVLRTVDGFFVEGPGSRLLFAFGRENQLQGMARSWKGAVSAQRRTIGTQLTSATLRSEIERGLGAKLPDGARAEVYEVRVVYYDGNRNFLQPLFRYDARVWTQNTSDDKPAFIHGYIAYGALVEPAPVDGRPELFVPPRQMTGRAAAFPAGARRVGVAGGALTGESPPATAMSPDDTGEVVAAPSYRVRGYVARQIDFAFGNSADALWNALSSTSAAGSLLGETKSELTPASFDAASGDGINTVQLALVEAHGTPGRIFTRGTGTDPVDIATLNRFGQAAGGRLNDWIIHSCEVVASDEDAPGTWDDAWWHVFGGVRNVVGYRTRMLYTDGATQVYGGSLGKPAPIVTSWLDNVVSLNGYRNRPSDFGSDGKVHPLGRPSAVSMCGRDRDNLFTSFSPATASCLTTWWVSDR
jgi:hypothetical protein